MALDVPFSIFTIQVNSLLKLAPSALMLEEQSDSLFQQATTFSTQVADFDK